MPEPEFYVGYHAPAPGVRLRPGALALLVLVPALGALLVAAHERRPAARFAYGHPLELTGRLAERPVPRLIVERSGALAGAPAASYALVRPGKHGAAEAVAGLDGRRVRLQGTLAERDGVTVVELVEGSLCALSEERAPEDVPERLGRFALAGEIVDSKCFFGVMNPGELKTHRACAARCISGGVPPVLCVRDRDGRAAYLFLLSSTGEPVHSAVLDLVAEPVEIEGEVERFGELLVLRADPSAYRRLP